MWEWLMTHPFELIVFAAFCFLIGMLGNMILNRKIRKEAEKEELEEAAERLERSKGQSE